MALATSDTQREMGDGEDEGGQQESLPPSHRRDA